MEIICPDLVYASTCWLLCVNGLIKDNGISIVMCGVFSIILDMAHSVGFDIGLGTSTVTVSGVVVGIASCVGFIIWIAVGLVIGFANDDVDDLVNGLIVGLVIVHVVFGIDSFDISLVVGLVVGLVAVSCNSSLFDVALICVCPVASEGGLGVCVAGKVHRCLVLFSYSRLGVL